MTGQIDIYLQVYVLKSHDFFLLKLFVFLSGIQKKGWPGGGAKMRLCFLELIDSVGLAQADSAQRKAGKWGKVSHSCGNIHN